jgi:SAM-dependent methyltransferase
MEARGYVLAKCMNCTHVQVAPIPDDKLLVSLYQNLTDNSFYGNGCSIALIEKFGLDKQFLIRFFSERIDVVKSLGLEKECRILDFGCTNGVFVKSLIDSGYGNGFGYDIAEDLVTEGRKIGLQLFTGELENLVRERESFFDMVISYNVFEHLSSPQFVLSKLKKLLKNGGYLVISIPYINSLQVKIMKAKSPIIDPPYHIHYFTIKSITRLLTDHGFTVLSASTPFWCKLTDIYLGLKGYNEKFAMVLRIMASPLRGVMNVFRLGGNLLVVARKV